MKYRVIHETRYLYTKAVSLCHSVAHLTPRNLPHQRLLRAHLTIDPMPSAYGEHRDIFGNTVAYFAVQQPHEHLVIRAASVVELSSYSPSKEHPYPNPHAREGHNEAPKSLEDVRARLRDHRLPGFLEAQHFMLPSPHVAPSRNLAAYAAPSFTPGRPVLEALRNLMERIHGDFAFVPGYTTVSTPLQEVLKHRKGVCQDFAHLAIGCLRSLGLAARYVSGYIETLPPPGKKKMRGADVSHAWYAVYLPDLGWLEYDPTNNLLPGDRHVTVAYGRDYADVVPVKGVIFSGGSQQLLVSVDMERLDAEEGPANLPGGSP
jgi:transglutaminase-like putative cysteine protease